MCGKFLTFRWMFSSLSGYAQITKMTSTWSDYEEGHSPKEIGAGFRKVADLPHIGRQSREFAK